jgi:transcriptional regulator
MGKPSHRAELLQGTLDMLILRAVSAEARHGYDIARWIQARSDEALQVEEGSLYPALYRLEERGFLRSVWDLSENKRRARFYELTARGRRQLADEREGWLRLTAAIAKVLA